VLVAGALVATVLPFDTREQAQAVNASAPVTA